VDLWENVEVGHVDVLVFAALYNAVVVMVATKFLLEELLAVVVESEIINGHMKYASVVAFVVFKGFFRQDFCILCLVQSV
jgi:hypothetical protein